MVPSRHKWLIKPGIIDKCRLVGAPRVVTVIITVHVTMIVISVTTSINIVVNMITNTIVVTSVSINKVLLQFNFEGRKR